MEENTKTTRILGIRPGKKEMGVAVLYGGELAYWGVTAFREAAEDDLAAAVAGRVRKLIATHRPSLLAIEAPAAMRLRSSSLLGSVVGTLEELARHEGLAFRPIEPATIRERLCGSAFASHAEVAELVVREHPLLGRYRSCGSAWRDAYWRPMFTAVGVALVCGQAR